MATTLTTNSSSPSSIQLRFALKPRNPSPFHTRPRSSYRGIMRSCAAVSSGGEKRSDVAGDSWASKDVSGDVFAGWAGDDKDDSSKDHKRGLGFVAAGVAGIFLLVGLALTSLYLRKRNPSALKLDMEPLPAQEEVLLTSDDQDDAAEQVRSEDSTASPDEEFLQVDCNIESTEGTHAFFSSPDGTDTTFEGLRIILLEYHCL